MVEVRLTRTFLVQGSGDLDAATDAVMEEMVKLESEDLCDSNLSANLADNIVELEMVGRAQTFDVAVERADSAIRTAIHAAGGATPNWSPAMEFIPTELHAEPVNA